MPKTYTTGINHVGEIIVYKNDKYFADIEYKSSCEAIVGELNMLDKKLKECKKKREKK